MRALQRGKSAVNLPRATFAAPIGDALRASLAGRPISVSESVHLGRATEIKNAPVQMSALTSGPFLHLMKYFTYYKK
jgi:hypothetical protein